MITEDLMARLGAAAAAPAPARAPQGHVGDLTDEQQRAVDAALSGRDVIVEAVCGGGKTSTIQRLTTELKGQGKDVLYLTYSRLLKADAQARVLDAGKVQNYHGLVYPHLLKHGIEAGLSESISAFNDNWSTIRHGFHAYDAIVIDEYQDINEEYAQLLRNVRSRNPEMLTVMVGDLEQRVSSNTRLDSGKFARGFVRTPALLEFTKSFRMGEYQAERLAKGWGKTVVGMNDDHEVFYLDEDEAFDLARATAPGDLLVLGRRKGQMPDLLNRLETEEPATFNKMSVYASIRERGDQGSYDQSTAIFTTYDSSKGLERDTVIVFDFDDDNWAGRMRMPDTDPEVLRNIFLVAASRGKRKIAFVSRRGVNAGEPHIPEGTLGGKAFTVGYMSGLKLRQLVWKTGSYPRPMAVSDMFDFKYAEAVRDVLGAVDRERLDDGAASVIDIERADGLIDLSPAVGNYQELLHFDRYDVAGEIRARKETSSLGRDDSITATGDPWEDALALTALDTDQVRYLTQVDAEPSEEAMTQLTERLAEHLPRDADVQRFVDLHGTVVSQYSSTALGFQGRIDAVHDGVPWELKFVTELTREMFLQIAMYCVLGGYPEGRLWNTRTGELWRVSVPDRQRFLDRVAMCVTKDQYDRYQG